jgi:hypothetical protein
MHAVCNNSTDCYAQCKEERSETKFEMQGIKKERPMIHVKDGHESSKRKEESEETHRSVQILAPGELVLQVATTDDLKKTD